MAPSADVAAGAGATRSSDDDRATRSPTLGDSSARSRAFFASPSPPPRPPRPMSPTASTKRRKPAVAHSLLLKWRRSYFEGIMRWEFVLRAFFVEMPRRVVTRIENGRTLVSFFFVYVMLQAVAILWGFLFNVGAVLGENMITIVTMPLVQALCVLMIYVSVMGIVLSFGRATWILTWQSLQNFPLIRRIIAVECRPQAVIITVAMPMLAILPNLILVPSHCRDSLTTLDREASSIMQTMCDESYLKFLTDKHPVFQRALRISTAIAICQFIQLCLEILPRWRTALSGLSTTSTFALGGWLLGLNVVGAMWSVEWSARHFGWKVTPLSDLNAFEWEVFGMALLMVWILWFLAVALHTMPNVAACEPSQKKLIGLFERLKFTFVVGQGIVFLRACLHPKMGFVQAQLELTIINLLLPSIYVVSLIILRMVSLLSRRNILVNVPLALFLGGLIFRGSRMTEKPHSFFVVSLFLFDTLLRSETAAQFNQMGRLTLSLQQMLRQTLPDQKRPLMGHSTAKRVVHVALALLLLFVGALSGFSILSVLQKSAKWFPDATSVEYDADQFVHIHHTAIVKLHLGLTDNPEEAMFVEEPEYATCTNRWRGLSVIDLAAFAEAAYFDPASNDTAKFLETMFGTTLGPIDVHLPELNTKTGSKLDFFEAYIPALNTSVISVRGTDIWRFTDFIEDVKMFFEPVVFAVLSAIFPTIRIWPDITFSTLIELYSEITSLFGLQHQSWYYHELLDYTNSITNRNVVLTGHSMGGGIARLVGSIVNKPSVTFSPPGVVQSYSKLVHHIGGMSLKVDRANLHHHSVAIIPEYDPVTMIDAQAGMVQKISCNTPNLSWQLSCHMLEGTLCNLLEHCGDPRGRISSCQFEHQIASITEDLAPQIAVAFTPTALITIAVSVSIVFSLLIRRRRRRNSLSPGPSPMHIGRRKSVSPSHRFRGHVQLGQPPVSHRRSSVI